MATMEIVILTKSSKRKGYCVAGIDLRTGEWVRLVSSDQVSDGALSDEDMTGSNGHIVTPLDIIRTDIERWEPLGCQEENAVLRPGRRWTFLRTASFDEVLKICPKCATEYIYGTNGKYITEEIVTDMHGSLLLAEITDLIVYRNEFNKLKCSFIYNGHEYHDMSMTDPDYYRYEKCKVGNAHIVVSLPHCDYNGKYYKFVAKIFPKCPPTEYVTALL